MRVAIPVLLALAALGGCIRTDGEMLDSSTAVISTRASPLRTPAAVAKATLVEAAQLAQKQGFEYFKIVSVADATQITSVYHPAQAHMNGNISMFGNMGELRGDYEATTTLTPAHTDTFVHPGADLMLKFFHAGEIDPHAPGVWEVASVLGGGW